MNKELLEQFKIKENLSDEKDEIIEKFKQNTEIYSQLHKVGLNTIPKVKDNIGTILTFYEDAIVCQSCPGIKNCPKEHPCFEIGLNCDGKYVTVTKSPCRKVNELMRLESYFIYHDFDNEIFEKNFSDISLTALRKPLIVKMAELINGKTKDWLYIRGGFNTGRSFICSCFATTFAKERSNPVAFCDTPKLVDDLKGLSIRNKELFEKRMDVLQNCPLLVLDGFGNEFMSEFNFASVIYPLLSERYRKGNLTIFTSDFTKDEVLELYSSKVGKARARQLSNIFEASSPKEFVLNGINFKK